MLFTRQGGNEREEHSPGTGSSLALLLRSGTSQEPAGGRVRAGHKEFTGEILVRLYLCLLLGIVVFGLLGQI